jgi:hypothetical protein
MIARSCRCASRRFQHKRGDATMTRKKRNLPKRSGELAKPIDIPWSLLDPKPPDESGPEVVKARIEKLPALAKALGLPSPPRAAALEAWYAAIALELAVLVCPGFQVKPPSSKLFQRGNIPVWLAFIDKWKRDGRVKSDLEGCTKILKLARPELARRLNRVKLRQQALTFANLISQERTSRKRRAHLG